MLKKIVAWFGWIVALVMAFLHFRRTSTKVLPGKVDAPPGQDKTGTLTQEEIERMRKELNQ